MKCRWLLLAGILGVVCGLAGCGAVPPAPVRETSRESTATSAMPPRETVCLNGVWQFRAAGTSPDQAPGDGWRPLRVPSSWGRSGENCFDFTPAERAASQAWYRQRFVVPAEWLVSGRVKLRFDAVVEGHRIVVNGTTVEDSARLALCREIDVTAQVHAGEDNVLEVLTRAFVASGPTPSGGKPLTRFDSGIIRDVFLLHRPELQVVYSHALPSVREHRLRVRAAIRNDGTHEQTTEVALGVYDAGRQVLSLPPRTVTVAPGQTLVIESEAPWADPVLWGFGTYGRPYLYTLRTTLGGGAGGGGAGDRSDERFGFREFRTSGQQFLLNEQPIVLRGDLSSRRGIFPENASYVTAYYQRLRDSGMNLQRLHSGLNSTFDDPAWYEVADETGMLVEAQLARCTTGGAVLAADSPALFALWTDYVNANFNHPGVVLWSVDNETFSVAAKDIPNIPADLVRAYDRLMTHVRGLDPTRVAEIHHNWPLWHFVKTGVFSRENFTTFNIHPYGKIDSEILTAMREVDFDHSVPVHVGELYTFPKDIDPTGRPGASLGEQLRKAGSYATQIASAAKVPDTAGITLCAMMADGYVGFRDADHVQIGPWDDFAVLRDAQGAPLGRREFGVDVAWPSLSGSGVKAEWIPGYHLYFSEGFGLNINWFDPTRPLWNPSLVEQAAKTAFERVAGGALPELNSERAAEIVVAFGAAGQPVTRAYVSLLPLQGQAYVPAVATDPAGTAWFRVWENGRYVAQCIWRGQNYRTEITVQRPALRAVAGYGHLQWVALGDGDPRGLQAAVAKPATFRNAWERLADDVAQNGGMEAWSATGPERWNGVGERSPRTRSGAGSSLHLTAPRQALTQPLRLERGRSYTLSGWCLSGAGTAYLAVKDGKYRELARVSAKAGQAWQHLEARFTAVVDGGYLYAGLADGTAGEAWIDEVTLLAGPAVDVVPEFDPGPFATSDGGFIRDWLALGPFPNRCDEQGVYEGFVTDWLRASGGEAQARPVFQDAVPVTFPAGGYWKPGSATLRWRPWSVSGDRVALNGLGLPALNISAADPNQVCAYLACTVESPLDRTGEISIGSDDGYKIWLNGEQVGALSVCRGSTPDQEQYPVTLRRGANQLLVKVFQDSGGWNCLVRFRDAAKHPLTDLTIRLAGEASGPRSLTPEGGGQPVPLPDGRRFVYEAMTATGGRELRMRDFVGTERVLGDGFNAVPSVDGTTLWYLRGDPAAPELVRLELREKLSPVVVAGPTAHLTRLHGWLEPQRLLVSTANGVCLLDVASPTPACVPWAPAVGADAVALSPDGRLAALVAPDAAGIPALRVIDVASGREVVAPRGVPPSSTGRVGGCHSPAFSPDSRSLAYIRAGIQPDADVIRLDLTTGTERALTTDRARNAAPRYLRDGSGVVYSAAKDGGAEQVWLLRFSQSDTGH